MFTELSMHAAFQQLILLFFISESFLGSLTSCARTNSKTLSKVRGQILSSTTPHKMLSTFSSLA